MPIFSLLYVSRMTIDAAEVDRAIDTIVATSVVRNGEAAITGALLHTGRHFAQILEGSEDAVRSLMERIARDGRHTEVIIVETRNQPARRFGEWQMAYCGTAVFIRQHVEALLPAGTAASPDRIERLRRLMRELAAAGGVSQR